MITLLEVVLLLIWWSVAAPLTGFIMGRFDVDEYGVIAFMMVIAATILWPVSVVIGAVIIIYRIPMATARTIRIDLRNRGLLREFDAWLRERNQ